MKCKPQIHIQLRTTLICTKTQMNWPGSLAWARTWSASITNVTVLNPGFQRRWQDLVWKETVKYKVIFISPHPLSFEGHHWFSLWSSSGFQHSPALLEDCEFIGTSLAFPACCHTLLKYALLRKKWGVHIPLVVVSSRACRASFHLHLLYGLPLAPPPHPVKVQSVAALLILKQVVIYMVI